MPGAFKGFSFLISNEASPEVYTVAGEVNSVSGVGVTNSQIDVTNSESGNTREYIAGMADGAEITVECNALKGNTNHALMRSKVDSGSNGNVRLVMTKSTTSPNETITIDMTVTFLSWQYAPSYDDKNTMSVTMKISGTPTVTEA